MKGLTVRQPWAWAIIHAGKNIENRSWTNRHVVGTIAIHAGSGLDSLDGLPRGVKKPNSDELLHGAIIGVVDVVAVVNQHRSKWFIGPLGWVLSAPTPASRTHPVRRSAWAVATAAEGGARNRTATEPGTNPAVPWLKS